MRFQFFAILLVVAGASAIPTASDVVVGDSPNQPAPKFIIASTIRRVIQSISDEIKKAGLDPLEIENAEYAFIPIPFFIEVRAFIENLKFTGASDIRVHTLNFNPLTNRCRFDISMPRISLTVGDSGVNGSVFGDKIEGQFKGSFTIQSIRLSGELRVTVGIITGINLQSVSMNFRVKAIRSDLTVSAQGTDYSRFLNTLFNETIPNALEDNVVEINQLLENIVRAIFDHLP